MPAMLVSMLSQARPSSSSWGSFGPQGTASIGRFRVIHAWSAQRIQGLSSKATCGAVVSELRAVASVGSQASNDADRWCHLSASVAGL